VDLDARNALGRDMALHIARPAFVVLPLVAWLPRAQLLTGRHGFRTGIGSGIGCDGGMSLRVDLETPLPRALGGYESAAVGKWHLVGFPSGTIEHPLQAGFGSYAGSLFNIQEPAALYAPCEQEQRLSYVNWMKTYDADGDGKLESHCTSTYATTDTTDEAILRVERMREPWFLYVGFNAPHWPLHRPPRKLCAPAERCPDSPCRARSLTLAGRRNAMVEALDTEIGRLLAEVRARAPDTFVFVIGDNGTDTVTSEKDEQSQWQGGNRTGKGSLFESGVNVPLIVAGPGIAPGESEALISSTDLYATIAELAGAPAAAEDSISFVPILRGSKESPRASLYAEAFFPNQPNARLGQPFAPTHHGRALRDERYKLLHLRREDEVKEFFIDLELDPSEQQNLLAPGGVEALAEEPRERYRRLRDELKALGVP
jgi:arylsulfatase A-like enzyme